MGKENTKPAYVKGNIMTRLFNHKENYNYGCRIMAVLAISATMLGTATVAYAIVAAEPVIVDVTMTDVTDTAPSSLYKANRLNGPLNDVSTSVAPESAAFNL